MTRNLNFQVVASMIILTGLFSCNEIKNHSGIEYLDFENTLGKTRTIDVSDIAFELEYVKLETTSASLIGSLMGRTPAIQIDNYYLISQRESPPLLFDINGKFIRKIGSIGRGPGELTTEYSVVANPGDKQIYILTNFGRDLKVYDLDGRFVRDVKLDRLHTFNLVKNDLFIGAVSTNPFDETRSYNYLLFNDKGETITTYKISGYADMALSGSTPDLIRSYVIRPTLSPTRTGTNINTLLNDTLFKILPDGSIESSFCWDLGRYKSPLSPEEEATSDKTITQKYAQYVNVHETNKYWVISFSLENRQRICLYDKSSGESFELDLNGINKDPLYGFLLTALLAPDDEQFYPFTPAFIKKIVESESFSKLEKTMPSEAHELIALSNSLKADDNPVIMKVKIK
jgi:hypothetical protein